MGIRKSCILWIFSTDPEVEIMYLHARFLDNSLDHLGELMPELLVVVFLHLGPPGGDLRTGLLLHLGQELVSITHLDD